MRSWVDEVGMMRDRINGNRARFVAGLQAAGAPGNHEALMRQRGMFSLLPLGEERVARLRDEFGVYVVGKGRVNVAGLTEREPGSGLPGHRRRHRRSAPPALAARPTSTGDGMPTGRRYGVVRCGLWGYPQCSM